MSKHATERWNAHLASDRNRSRTYRERAIEIGRPLPSAIDRAIARAVHEVWVYRIVEATGGDPDLERDATALPISPYKIAERATEILIEAQARKSTTVDAAVVGRAVMARLRPRLPDQNARRKRLPTTAM